MTSQETSSQHGKGVAEEPLPWGWAEAPRRQFFPAFPFSPLFCLDKASIPLPPAAGAGQRGPAAPRPARRRCCLQQSVQNFPLRNQGRENGKWVFNDVSVTDLWKELGSLIAFLNIAFSVDDPCGCFTCERAEICWRILTFSDPWWATCCKTCWLPYSDQFHSFTVMWQIALRDPCQDILGKSLLTLPWIVSLCIAQIPP